MAGGLYVESVEVLITLGISVENMKEHLRRYLGRIMMIVGLPRSLGQLLSRERGG